MICVRCTCCDELNFGLSVFSLLEHQINFTQFTLRSPWNVTCLLVASGLRASEQVCNLTLKSVRCLCNFFFFLHTTHTAKNFSVCQLMFAYNKRAQNAHRRASQNKRKQKSTHRCTATSQHIYWQFGDDARPLQTHREACDNHTLHARRNDWTQTVQFVNPTWTVVLVYDSRYTKIHRRKSFPCSLRIDVTDFKFVSMWVHKRY